MRSKDEDDGWWDDTQADKIWKEFGKESTAPLSKNVPPDPQTVSTADEIDSQLKKEHLATERFQNERYRDDSRLRKTVASWSLIFVAIQLSIADGLSIAYFVTMLYRQMPIPTQVIVAWLSATLVEIIGILWVVTRSLFPFHDGLRDKAAEKTGRMGLKVSSPTTFS